MNNLQKVREAMINGMGQIPTDGGRIYVKGETYACTFLRADLKECLVWYNDGHKDKVTRAEHVTEWIPF